MPAYVVVEVDVNDPETYEDYKRLAPPPIAAYGGRYLARGGRTATLEGDWSPTRVVLLKFPSPEKARAFYDSPEYQAARKAREGIAVMRMVLIEGT